jgi:hypothetical protein
MRSKMKVFPGVLSIIMAIGLAACGGDGGSGVDGDKKLAELTPAEQQALCEESAAQAEANEDDALKVGCYLQASLFGQCSEAAVQQCISQAQNAPQEGECQTDVTDACTATVGELRACFDAQVDALGDIASKINCENALTLLGSAPEPAACKTAESKCPELFEDEDEG